MQSAGEHYRSEPITSFEIVSRVGEEPGLKAKVESILREWIYLCYSPITQRDPQSALGVTVKLVGAAIIHMYTICLFCAAFQMHEKGFMATDEMISKFFRMAAEICLDVSYRLLKNGE